MMLQLLAYDASVIGVDLQRASAFSMPHDQVKQFGNPFLLEAEVTWTDHSFNLVNYTNDTY